MKEINYIMTTMTNNSLIIIDELCRSTSLEEGTALAIAIIEKLAHSSAFVYITTHFTLLTKLYEMYLNVKVWQLETIASGDDPKTFKLDFKYGLIPGVNSLRHYGVYILRNIWSASILKYVDTMLEKISKQPANPTFVALDKRKRLRHCMESEIRKLKSQDKLTIDEINKLQNQYQNEMRSLDISVNEAALLNEENFVENMPQIRHSIFDTSQNLEDNYLEDDVQSTDERMKQIFTPQLSECSEASIINLQGQKSGDRTGQMVFPDLSQHSYVANDNFLSNYTGNDFYKSNDNGDAFSETLSYKNISNFINEDSKNIYKLVPEVNINYKEVSNTSTENSDIGSLKTEFFKQPENNIVSQNACQKLELPKPFQKYKAEKQKMSANCESASTINVSKDMDDFRFSEPLYSGLARTSTPIELHTENFTKSSSSPMPVYNQRRNFSSLSSNTRYELEQPKEFEDLDLESLQEDLEVCSKIFDEDDDFERSVLNIIDAAKSKKTIARDKKDAEQNSINVNHQHIMPRVIIIEGPDNTTLSFDENDFTRESNEPIQEQKTCVDKNKINIISDIVITASGTIKNGGNVKSDNFNDCTSECKVNDENAKMTNTKSEAEEETIGSRVNDILIKEEQNKESDHYMFENWSKACKEQFITYRDIYANDSSQSNDLFEDTGIPKNPNIREINFDNTFMKKAQGASVNSCKDKSTATKEISHKVVSHELYYNNQQMQTDNNLNNSDNTSICRETPSAETENAFVTSPNSQNRNQNCEQSKTNDNIDTSNNIDKTASTGISHASKLRNLEQNTSESTPTSATDTKKTPTNKSMTSISTISRKRNLDQVTTNTTSSDEANNESAYKKKIDSSTRSSLENNSGSKRENNVRKRFSSPKDTLNDRVTEGESQQSDVTKKIKKRAPLKKKFKPPRKLTAKEIKEEFREQDRKILEASPSSSNFSKYLQQLITRPSVKQIQNTTHLAFITKTNEGFEVIPARPAEKKLNNFAIKRQLSDETVDVTIFSDKNAKLFESYLSSTEKHYKTFSFNCLKNRNENSSDTKFKFDPKNQNFGEYTKTSVTTHFVRSASEISKSQSITNCSQQIVETTAMRHGSVASQNLVMGLTQQSVATLTPDGFYKQNKEDITRIISKYLQNNSPGKSQETGLYTSKNVSNRKSIFENGDLSDSDLNI